jgi:hypothetical protein
MTTLPDLWTKITEIQDRDALQLVHRMVQSELTIVEAQMAQLQQVSRAIEDRMKTLDAQGGGNVTRRRSRKEGAE